jgi:prepilin-type N-terminal cleavage/methylation domain-containing protein
MYFRRPGRECSAGAPRAAFTLIELLVVVSIIALLISILLPSLRSARESAKTVVCMANLGGIARNNAIYHSRSNDFLAGSVGTSGSVILRHPDRSDWTDVDTWLPTEMLQPWDWATPLELLDSTPADRREHYKVLFERYRCPKNNFLALPVVGAGETAGAEWPMGQAPSYYTARQLLFWPANSPSAPYSAAAPGSTHGEGDIDGDGAVWQLPRGYSPRLERIGNPSEKVFMTDGSRWTDEVTGAFTYNIEWNSAFGGAFSTGGASLEDEFLRDFWFPYGSTAAMARVTYRHQKSGNVGVAVSFFDGHTAYLSEPQSRHPDFWYPKGTKLTRGELNRPALKLVQPYFVNARYTVK